jgi:hypothetical protein
VSVARIGLVRFTAVARTQASSSTDGKVRVVVLVTRKGFRYEPAGSGGLRALRRRLEHRGAGAPADILGPISALRELDEICAGMLPARGGPNKSNRTLLTEEIRRALKELGPETAAAAGPQLKNFIAELSRLAARLSSPPGARVTALQVDGLLGRFQDERVVIAAWRDAVDVFNDDDSAAELCELRVAQLTELAEHRGVDYAQWAHVAAWVLGDDARFIRALGEPVAETDEANAHKALVAEDRRLTLCEEQLRKLPQRSGIAVWLIIDNAALPDTALLALGPVWLFDGHSWPADCNIQSIIGNVTDGLPTPPGFEHWPDASEKLLKLPAARHRVFARVLLEDTTAANARGRARRVLQEMIDLSGAGSGWSVREDSALWREHGGWSFEGFQKTSEEDPRPQPGDDLTAINLQTFDADFVSRWVDGEDTVAEAVDDALWSVAVARAPTTAQRIMLAIRAVERTLGAARAEAEDTWAAAASRYLRAPWVKETLNIELRESAFVAFNHIELGGGAPGLQARLLDLITTTQTWREFMCAYAPMTVEAQGVLPEGSLEHRVVREAAAVLNDPVAAQRTLRHLGVRFDRLLDRAERQRNALVHGTGTTDAALTAVDHFVVVLAELVAHEAMSNARTRAEPLAGLERARVQALDRDALLELNESPVDAVWQAGS